MRLSTIYQDPRQSSRTASSALRFQYQHEYCRGLSATACGLVVVLLSEFASSSINFKDPTSLVYADLLNEAHTAISRFIIPGISLLSLYPRDNSQNYLLWCAKYDLRQLTIPCLFCLRRATASYEQDIFKKILGRQSRLAFHYSSTKERAPIGIAESWCSCANLLSRCRGLPRYLASLLISLAQSPPHLRTSIAVEALRGRLCSDKRPAASYGTMDDNNRSRRPEDLPIPAGYAYFQQPLQGQHSQQEQQQRQQQQHYSQQQQQQTRTWPTRANLGNVRNYRPEPGIGRPNPTPPSMASRHLSGSGVYNDSPYYQESTANAYASTAIPQANLGYHHPPSTGYGQQPDPRQAQTYATSSYHPNSAMMYNVTPATSTPNASMYDASQSFPPRPAAGMQVSPTEAASHFSYQNGSPSVSASASALRSDMTTANASQHVYQQQSSLQGYPSAMNPLGAMAAQSTATPDASMDDQASATDEDPQRSFEHYQTTLREAFRDMRDGALVAASDHLLVATNELLDGFVRWGTFG